MVHNLLSMTGDIIPQPFRDVTNGLAALFNGEIYNAKAFVQKHLRQPYDIRSDGDALLPLLRNFGAAKVFRWLSGEWAIAFVDFSQRRPLQGVKGGLGPTEREPRMCLETKLGA